MMRDYLKQFLVLAVFLSVYYALNWYVLSRFLSFVNTPFIAFYHGLLLAFVFVFLLTGFLAHKFSNHLTIVLYNTLTLWLGVLAILTPVLLLEHLLSVVFDYALLYAAVSTLLVSLVLILYAVFTAHRFKHKELRIVSGKLAKDYVLVHLSDLHLGPIHTKKYLDLLIKEVSRIDPDIIIITGDIIDLPAITNPSLLSAFDVLSARIYATSGNHDRYTGISVLEELIRNSKICFIDGKTVVDDELEIIGVADSDDAYHLSKNMSKASANHFSILSYHRPIEFSFVADNGVDLMLSGHTHAGQILSFRPFVKLVFSHVWGLYSQNNSYLHVTCGTGTWGPPMRLGSYNEITTIHLQKS